MPAPLLPNAAEARKYYDSGVKSCKKNNFIEAESFFAQAISLDEGNAEYWLKLGLVWGKMNRHEEAIEANTMATSLTPQSADAHYNLGLSYLATGQTDKGMTAFQHSFKLDQNEDLAEKLGDYFFNNQDYKSAAYYYFHLYTRKKSATREEILDRLATSLYRNGDLREALGITVNLVKRFPQNARYTNLLLDLYRRVPHIEFSQDAKDILERLLKSGKTKYLFLRNPWISLFLLDDSYKPLHVFVHPEPDNIDIPKLTRILKTDFLCLGLQKGLTTNIPVETIFTNLRRHLLLNWDKAENWPDTLFSFISSLAVGCWYNDFVYYVTPEEKSQLPRLRAYIEPLLKAGEKAKESEGGFLSPADSMLLALLACYVPLCEFCDAPPTQLRVARKLQQDFSSLLNAQLLAPLEEKNLLSTIPFFASVDDDTSLAVQAMYMARPYPRWVSTASSSPYQGLKQDISILVAGCGTGHEPALYAMTLPTARITAIDLSPASIAYAKRMAIQLGIDDRIEFFLGDLMKAQELEKQFDFVTSSGVLHHLKDPEKGLEAILQTLKDDGRLSISLYSKHAREHVLNPASAYIREKGYSSSTEDIRQFRRDVMMMTAGNPVTRCTSAGDFYFLSECNDLLFHVQEHRYTPHMIWDMAERHGLTPFHISMTSDRQKAFEGMFPGQSPLNPDLLEKFEQEHPKAFIEMYKIFLRRKNSVADSPIDALIRGGNL